MTIQAEPLIGNDVFVLHDFLSPAECDQFIARTEAIGYEDAPITTATGFVMMKEYRNNARVMIDDVKLAATLWAKAQPFIPTRWSDHNNVSMNVAGLNERFRFYRYHSQQKFNKHYDGSFRRNENEISQLTFMVYLNEACSGGETVFYDDDVYPAVPQLRIRPQRGKALIFRHGMLHEGAAVRSGVKYVLRSDVMYRYPTLAL